MGAQPAQESAAWWPPLSKKARRQAPADATRGRTTLTTVARIKPNDWVRLIGHVDWQLAQAEPIVIGMMARTLWVDRRGVQSSDMLMAEAPCEVVHGGPCPGIEGA